MSRADRPQQVQALHQSKVTHLEADLIAFGLEFAVPPDGMPSISRSSGRSARFVLSLPQRRRSSRRRDPTIGLPPLALHGSSVALNGPAGPVEVGNARIHQVVKPPTTSSRKSSAASARPADVST